MKKRNYLTVLLIVLFWVLTWCVLNLNYIMTVDSNAGSEALYNILGTAGGYYWYRLHPGIYMVIFTCCLVAWCPDYNEQHLIRLKREKCILSISLKMLIAAFTFSFIYCIIGIFPVILLFDWKFLSDYRILLATVFVFLEYSCFYMIFGALYVLILTVTMNKTIGCILTSVISMITYGFNISFGKKIWTPLENLSAYDKLFTESGIDILVVMRNIVNSIFIVLIFIVSAYYIYIKKDIIVHRKIHQ